MYKVLSGSADVSLEQSISLGQHFGSMTKRVYSHVYSYMERKPLQRPNFTNIVYPLDVYTYMLLSVAYITVSLVLWILAPEMDALSQPLLQTLQTTYGIMFQEYYQRKGFKKKLSYFTLRFLWVATTFVISMAFLANLKSSLTKKNYEERTMHLDEMIDKDMKIHSSLMQRNYLEGPTLKLRPINERLLCQIKKKDSTYIPEFVFNMIILYFLRKP